MADEYKVIRWGYPVKTNSDECVNFIDAYFQQVLYYGADRHIILKAGEADGECVLANTLIAFFLAFKAHKDALFHLHAAQCKLGVATVYEKMVFKAVSSWVEAKEPEATLDLHSQLLKDFPKDLASLKRAQVLCFYIGRPDFSLQLVEQVLPENQDENYIYGMLSFPLLEVGRMRDAELAARKGLAIKSDDPWSQHALCHVFQHECRFNEAVHFMETCADSWNACCSFMYTHNWWHLALCYLEGHAHLSKIFDIYDSHIWAALQQNNVDSPQVYLNALGLLLHVHVRGNSTDIHDRMRDLVVCLMDQSSWHQEWLLDLLATWAFAYANAFSQADQLLKGMKGRVNEMQGKRRESMQRVLLLAEALYQYGKGDYTRAYDTLGPNFNVLEYKVIGASDEQLDVFEEVWCVILINSGHISQAIQALERRVEIRSGVPFTWRLLVRDGF
ncbi:uncharacterized protein LOC131038538 isoform X1 [Cryptomeria japonica]|uniref:uncharacterized protein LOC131038538 isoform X1 n=1 Tax=Cryptomeria japonica TaxID=3369 RepID=UPI0027DA34BB|nr:uncharacterized protein LOC131038538 isoform X1 [Cryptomeria japonica]